MRGPCASFRNLRPGANVWRRNSPEKREEPLMVDLSKARVLMLATDGFEQSELFEPRKALIEAGAQVTLASLKPEPITGEQQGEKGESITPDTTINQVDSEGFDALVL